MSTQRESTLQVKDFAGISRYLSSPNEPPNKFYTIQNMWSPNRGELQTIPGTQNVVAASAMNGVGTLDNIYYLDQSFGQQQFVAVYTPTTVTGYPTPSGMTFTPVGATSSIIINTYFVHQGGVTSLGATTTSVGASGVTVAPPTNTPSSVSAIHYYYAPTSGSWNQFWAGTQSRIAGSFANTFRLPPLPFAVTTTTVTGIACSPSGFTGFPAAGSGGTLVKNRSYFFGICPYAQAQFTVGDVEPQDYVALYSSSTSISPSGLTSSQDILSYFYAEDGVSNQHKFRIKFASLPCVQYTSVPSTVSFSPANFILFMGQTPEDLLPLCDSSGVAIPFAASALTGGGIGGGILIDTLPIHSNLGVSMADSANNATNTGTRLQGRNGTRNPGASSANAAGTTGYSKAMCAFQIPYTEATRVEIYPFAFSDGYNSLTNPSPSAITATTSLAYEPGQSQLRLDGTISSDYRGVSYQDRIYLADSYNSHYYTNGIQAKYAIPTAGAAFTPIAQYIQLFQDKIILGGAGNSSNGLQQGSVVGAPSGSFFNSPGVVYFSNVAQPYNFGPVGVATGAYLRNNWNGLSVNGGDNSPIRGFGIFSQDLSTVGVQSFLVIGKGRSSLVWGGSSSSPANEIGSRVGWASPDGYVRTTVGPFVLSNDGIYKMNGSEAFKISMPIDPILQSLPSSSISSVVMRANKDRMIIGYNSGTGTSIDRELWCDFRRSEEDGQISHIWTGPHLMTPYNKSIIAPQYGTNLDYRISFLSSENKITQRDVASVYTDLGSAIPVVLQMNQQTLSADEFMKLITKCYIRAKINQAVTCTFTATSIDQGSMGQGLDFTGDPTGSISESIALPYPTSNPANMYRTFQKVFSNRYLGTVFNPTLSFSVSSQLSIVSMDLLFQTHRRRLL